MAHHDLKLHTPYFAAKADGVKPWEIRMMKDRVFTVGDTVTFHEVNPETGQHTGVSMGPAIITYVLSDSLFMLQSVCIFTHSECMEPRHMSDPIHYIKRLERRVIEQGDEIKRLQALLRHHSIEPHPCPLTHRPEETTC